MKAKKTLVLVVITLALLAVALILPAAAYGKRPANEPVSWVSVGTNYWLPGGFHGGTEAKVQKFADDTFSGKVIVKVLRESYDGGQTWFHYVVKTSDFASPDWWDYAPPGLAYSDFFIAGDNWPGDLGPAPDWWPDYEGAAVADFVAYVPVSEYPESLPWLVYFRPPFTDPFPAAPSIPLRFMFIDAGKSGKADVMLNWLFVGLQTTTWNPTVWTVPIQSGNIQVHVGNLN